jgi:2',3'-cyclic-nucleotide 2'-phosphodiesterase
MNILFIGDIMGNPGRKAVKRLLPDLRIQLEIDLVIANCENSAGGKGVTEKVANELFHAGCDLLTGGNHIFAQKSSYEFLDREERIVRPLNYPPGAPGHGWVVHECETGPLIGVINACGRTFMGPHYDDPFRAISSALEQIHQQTPLVFVDFHAEASSEKVAMGWYLDGQVTAVVGTHTHVQTADERLLHKGTAYITDAGMTGSHDSVIGDDKEIILEAILTQMPKRFEIAQPSEITLCGVLIKADPETGAATHIERLKIPIT